MAMPETAMNKYNCFILCQNYIRLSWKIFNVKPITKSMSMQETTYQHFRFGILSFNTAHVIASNIAGVYVRHKLYLLKLNSSTLDFPKILYTSITFFFFSITPKIKAGTLKSLYEVFISEQSGDELIDNLKKARTLSLDKFKVEL